MCKMMINSPFIAINSPPANGLTFGLSNLMTLPDSSLEMTTVFRPKCPFSQLCDAVSRRKDENQTAKRF